MLQIFNPDHDQCLANGNRYYCSSATSLKFAEDCADIMRYADDTLCLLPGTDIRVWGWDQVVRQRLLNMGIDPSLLPDDEMLERIRNLSHRRTSLEMNAFLKQKLSGQERLAYPFQTEIRDMEQLLQTVRKHGSCIVKAPWSSSGKGLRRLYDGEVTGNELGRIARLIAKQGSVIVESLDEVVLDFAMLFETDGQNTSFRGYSLFENERCAYSRGILAGDTHIHNLLASYVGAGLVIELREALSAFLNRLLCGSYRGPLGVDMYICRSPRGEYLLRPCVEINLRLTMGFVAHRLCSEYFSPEAEGHYALQLLHSFSNSELRRQISEPQVFKLLTPLREDSNYAFVIARV